MSNYPKPTKEFLKKIDGPCIAGLSGGKDSMVMTDLLCKHGYHVDYIVFYDTLMEFPMMYQYIEKIKEYFKSRYNKEVITTKPTTTFEAWCFGIINDTSAIYHGAIRGIPMVWSEPCYWRRESKLKPFNEFISTTLGEDTKHFKYIGFTLDEASRRLKDENAIYPLIDFFKMREVDCQSYLIDQEMENPLYRYFTRTGCGICPAQSDRAWFQVWKYFPETWEYMKWIEKRLHEYMAMGMKVKNAYWFTGFRTCEQMEDKFKEIDKTGSMFNFLDEPHKDCFCKI